MMNKNMITNLTRKGLNLLERRAEKKANAECIGLVYEPKIPNKLKRNIAKGLACALAITGVLGSSVGTYKAADNREYATWYTQRVNVAVGNSSDYVELYNTKEQYEWAVTSVTLANGYGYVELSGTNNTVVMLNSSGVMDTSIACRLTQVHAAKFKIYNVEIDDENSYAKFRIAMTPYSDGNRFQGYVKILKGTE